MSHYLYGASIQGIQGFIFQTSTLKEIIGGSELVEELCKDILHKEFELPDDFPGLIQSAAGNIKILFSEEDKRIMERLILHYPKKVMEIAPGITVSQAVQKFDPGTHFKEVIDALEKKLKVQRSKPSKPLEVGFMGLARERSTGNVACWLASEEKKSLKTGNEIISSSTQSKLRSEKEEQGRLGNLVKKTIPKDLLKHDKPKLTNDLAKFTAGHKNNWIAVVHVDGNGLGKLIQELSEKLKDQSAQANKEAFRKFSLELEFSTQEAAQAAFAQVFGNSEFETIDFYPFRPIVCGGDDLTVIIRADKALAYTQAFLHEFGEKTKSRLSFLKDEYKIETFSDGLTACAGIAYIKKSYPLHYALDLAETLTKEAKKTVKQHDQFKTKYGLPKSSLAFYKVQESFLDDLQELKKRTLLAKGALDYFGGPYLLEDLNDQLIGPLEILKKEAESKASKSKAVGKLRSIVSETFENLDAASFSLERMKEVNDKFYKELPLLEDFKKTIDGAKSGTHEKSILFDLISLHSFNYGKHGENRV